MKKSKSKNINRIKIRFDYLFIGGGYAPHHVPSKKKYNRKARDNNENY